MNEQQHENNAVDFFKATRWIRENLPGAHVSGGVSNVSFSFRGNNTVREAMNSAFLYHAINEGMDMGIVNPTMLEVYDDIPKDLLEHVEDVLLNRRDDATERLLDFAESYKSEGKKKEKDDAWRKESVEKRLEHALVKGIVEFIDDDAVITTMSEEDDQEDVQVIIGDNSTVFVRQWQEYKNEFDVVVMTFQQLLDIVAAVNSPEGLFKLELIKDKR